MQTFFLGLDLGQSRDYSALSIVERIEDEPDPVHHVRHLQRWPLKTSYPRIVRDVQAILDKPPIQDAETCLALDATGVGQAVTDMFRKADLNTVLMPVLITGGQKESRADGIFHVPKKDLVDVVRISLDNETLKIAGKLPNAKLLTTELQNFQVRVTGAANEVYGTWREKEHDDLVLSVALALWASDHHGVIGSRAVLVELHYDFPEF